MACQGFSGIMSCSCLRECWEFLGPRSVGARTCFEEGPHSAQKERIGMSVALSDGPRNTSAVRFLTRHGPIPQGWTFIARPPRHELPLPVARCPGECHHRGTCSRAKFGATGAAKSSRAKIAAALPVAAPSCNCHAGFFGDRCESLDDSSCMGRCSTHGRCFNRICLCRHGWVGVDCSLPAPRLSLSAGESPSEAATRPLAFAPIFVYPLPTEMGMQHLAQNDPNPGGSSTFYANRIFLERLHLRRDAIVSNPEEAALFFVPSLLMQRQNNLWQPGHHLEAIVAHVRTRYPFWNRSKGADHVFFSTLDMGGCWVTPGFFKDNFWKNYPRSLRNSIVLSYFGYKAASVFFSHEARYQQSLEGRLNSNWAKMYYNASLPKCFEPGRDVVVPTDFTLPAPIAASSIEAETAAAALAAAGVAPWDDASQSCRALREGPRRILLYMSGSIKNVAPWYSQGVRQSFYKLHTGTPGVRIEVGTWKIEHMRAATFCLAPSGWGFGWRTYLAVATLCIPVIVQAPFFTPVLPPLLTCLLRATQRGAEAA